MLLRLLPLHLRLRRRSPATLSAPHLRHQVTNRKGVEKVGVLSFRFVDFTVFPFSRREKKCYCCCLGPAVVPPRPPPVPPALTPAPAIDDARALARACIRTASSALCAASTRPPPPIAVEEEEEGTPPPTAAPARAAASSAAEARIALRVALSHAGTFFSSSAALRATSRSGEELEGAPWSTGRDLSWRGWWWFGEGCGVKKRLRERRRRRSIEN